MTKELTTKINKEEFREKIAEKTNESKTTVDKVVTAMFEMVNEEILSAPINRNEKREVRFPPFGKFDLRRIAPSRNRRVGSRVVDIDEQYYVGFKSFEASKVRK